MKKLSQDEFIKKSYDVHGNTYNYDLVEYINSKTHVLIKCHKHGAFKQKPNNHLSNHGCPKCRTLRLNNDKIISQFKKRHGDIYNYDLVDFKGVSEKIQIICSKHGIFNQKANVHYRSGCPKCNTSNKMNLTEFIEKSNKIHNLFYNYDKSKYTISSDKITITCPKHGNFNQISNDHLRGSGCPKCVHNVNKLELIGRFNDLHQNTYSYKFDEYNNQKDLIDIVCNKHGLFNLKIIKHLSGVGCPRCKKVKSKGELKISNILNKYNIKFKSQHRFNNCKYKNKLPFDFYIPLKNIAIEYDGIQHFEKRFNITNIEFDESKKRDSIKNRYCEENNIYLIRIPYTDYNNVEDILQKNNVIS